MGCKLVDIASLLQRYFAPSLWLAIGCNSIVSIFRERQNCLSLRRRELPSPSIPSHTTRTRTTRRDKNNRPSPPLPLHFE